MTYKIEEMYWWKIISSIDVMHSDFLNNAANKVSRRFGKGMGIKIHDIVKTRY